MTKIAVRSVLLALTCWLVGCGGEVTAAKERLYPEPDSAGSRLLLSHCASCHAAPLPSTHSQLEWPGIVQRMQRHMVSKAFKPLSEDEQAILTTYLQQHAGLQP